LKILVIEDNVKISEALGSSVMRGKILSVKWLILVKGLDRIRAVNFDLILLDLAMPDFSGMDVLLSLKLDGLIKSRNIVIFTASSNQDLLHEIIDIGVKEIFKRPFSLDDSIK
jgi:DNA-binding response OmpR family regulator